MQIYIKFKGVIDHLDILSEELKYNSRLKNNIRLTIKDTPQENQEQIYRLRKTLEKVEALESFIEGRKKLLLEITSVMESVSKNTNDTVTEIGYIIDKLGEGEQSE